MQIGIPEQVVSESYRGQLGATRIVRFQRSGRKVLLLQVNPDYRANGSDAEEPRSA